MLVTLLCLVTVLGGLFLLGTPFRWLLNGCRPLGRAEWLEVPAVGIAVIVLVLHNLVYLDIPIGRCVGWIWLSVALLWGVMAWRRQILASLGGYPLTVFAVGLAVFCVQGLGLFIMGAEWYAGRAHSDQYNYTAVAQFLTDWPFSTTLRQIGYHPYLIDAIKLKYDRIGVMLLQGWFAATAHLDARTLFEPTILLCPTLVVLAIHSLGRRVGLRPGQALLAAACAGLLPGLALVHLESFLGHALSIPLLFFCLLALYDLVEKPGLLPVLRVGLLLSATTAIYTELAPLLAGLVVLILGGALLFRVLRVRSALLCLVALPALMVLLNPLYLPILYRICQRSMINTSTNGFVDLYPWAFQLQGLGCLWVCDLWAAKHGNNPWIGWGSLAVTVHAVFGLLRLWSNHLAWMRQSWRDVRFRHSLLLATGVVVVGLLPLLVLARGTECPYQLYKLLLSVSPLLVLGVAVGVTPTRLPKPAETTAQQLPWTRRQVAAGLLPLLFVLMLATSGTIAMALQSTNTSESAAWRGSGQYITGNPCWRGVLSFVRAAPPSNLILAAGPNVFKNCWPAYFARRHQVWLTNPAINDANRVDTDFPEAAHVLDLNTVPTDAYLLTGGWTAMCTQVGGDAQIFWANPIFQIWKLGPGPLVIRTHIDKPTYIWYDNGPYSITLGVGPQPALMHFWARRAGQLRLTGSFLPAPKLPPGATLRIRFTNAQGQSSSVLCKSGKQTVSLPLEAGKSVVKVECLASPDVPAAAQLVHVENLAVHITDRPGAARERAEVR
jgi:hypothetical protein